MHFGRINRLSFFSSHQSNNTEKKNTADRFFVLFKFMEAVTRSALLHLTNRQTQGLHVKSRPIKTHPLRVSHKDRHKASAYSKCRSERITLILRSLHWLPARHRMEYMAMLIYYESIHCKTKCSH